MQVQENKMPAASLSANSVWLRNQTLCELSCRPGYRFLSEPENTMHAMVLKKLRSTLEWTKLPDRQPGPGEIRVRVGRLRRLPHGPACR